MIPTNNTVTNYITEHNLIAPGSTVILGFSGGPDSVYLLHQLAPLRTQLNFTLIAAHLNHGWRAEAHEDVNFCATMAAQLNVPFVTAHAQDFPHIKSSGSLEQQGRQLRRAFFEQLAQTYPNSVIALGHHQDDQIETFFIRLIRGTGLEGLTGMLPLASPANSFCTIRPLLCINKQTILQELTAHAIPYLTDSTNTNTEFLRNSIRLQALPTLTACDARFTGNLLRTIAHLQEADDYIHQETLKAYTQLLAPAHTALWLNKTQLLALHPFMRMRVILHWLCQMGVPFTPSQSFFAEIERFLAQPGNATHTFYHAWVMKKQGALATIELLPNKHIISG